MSDSIDFLANDINVMQTSRASHTGADTVLSDVQKIWQQYQVVVPLFPKKL